MPACCSPFLSLSCLLGCLFSLSLKTCDSPKPGMIGVLSGQVRAAPHYSRQGAEQVPVSTPHLPLRLAQRITCWCSYESPNAHKCGQERATLEQYPQWKRVEKAKMRQRWPQKGAGDRCQVAVSSFTSACPAGIRVNLSVTDWRPQTGTEQRPVFKKIRASSDGRHSL